MIGIAMYTMILTLHKQGIEKGRTEGAIARNIEIARNLSSEGMAIKSIAKITGLSEEEIKKL